MIHLIEVHNPFLAATARTNHDVEWQEGITLGDILRAAGVPAVRHACVIDGLVVHEEMLEAFQIADGAAVVCMPSVAGGSFTKMFAEIAVMVAAAALTAGLSTGIAFLGMAGLGMSATTAGIIGSTFALGGNMLVNALMTPSSGGVDSNSFDPTGPKTIASGGTPIPKGYGDFLSGGNIIGSFVSAEGQDNYLNVLVSFGWGQAASIGNISLNNNSIGNYTGVQYATRLGTNTQTPIPFFNQIVNGYPQNVRVIATAAGGTPVVIQGTGTATQGLQVVVQFPDGVFYSNNDGSLRSLSIAYKIEYAVSGTNNWITPTFPDPVGVQDLVTYYPNGTVEYAPTWVVIPTDSDPSAGLVYAADTGSHYPGQPWSATQKVEVYNPDGSGTAVPVTLYGEWQPFDITLNQKLVQNFNAGYIIFTDANQGTLYHSTNIYNLPPAKYDVRVTKYGSAFAGDPIQPREGNNNRTGDQIWVHSVNEVQYQDLAYPNMILLAVRALATNQVSGSGINITAQVSYLPGSTVPAELLEYGVKNPAVVAYDMLCEPLYGGGVSAAQIDLPAFLAWAEYCNETVADGFGGTIPRAQFNGVFDTSGTNLWKSLQKVASLGFASIVQIGRNYTVILDAPVTIPAQVFHVGNIIRDSMKDTWLSLDDRANRIEVTFADAARTYRTDEPCAVMLKADIEAGVEVKPTRVPLLGCTNRAQAWHWAYRKLLSTDALLLTRSIDVGVEAVACQVGSVIGIQDDVTEWAEGGRIQDGSTTTNLIIDRDDLVYVAGEGYTVSIVHPVVERGSLTAQSVVGNIVTLSGPLPTGRVLGVTNQVGAQGAITGTGTSVIAGVTVGTVRLQSASGFAAGDTLAFYDTDVLDTQPVTALNGYALTPAAPFIQTPTADCTWVYGQSAGSFPAKLFTVTNIKRKSDFVFTLDTIQYDNAVYADDTPIITETIGAPDVQAAVTSLNVVEQYTQANGANGGVASTITVGWINGPNTAAVQIWVARNEPNQPLSREVLYATVSAGTTCILNGIPTGTILQIRVVGIDGQGRTAPYQTAPLKTLTVQGSGLAAADITRISGQTTAAGTTIAWLPSVTAATYEVRYQNDVGNTDWDTATLLWSGTATVWAEAVVRYGRYLVKAVSAAGVESINTISYSYLESNTRLNVVGLIPGQALAVYVTANSYDATSSKSTVTLTMPAQSLTRQDGTSAVTNNSTLTFPPLTPGATYTVYTYVDTSNFLLHSGAGDSSLPDTAPNATSQAICSATGNYPGPVLTITAASSSGSGTGPSSPPNDPGPDPVLPSRPIYPNEPSSE